MKIRVAFIVWTLKYMSGSERVIFDIARKLDKNRYSVKLISFEDGPERKEYEDGFPFYIDFKNFNVIFRYHRVMMVKSLIGIQ